MPRSPDPVQRRGLDNRVKTYECNSGSIESDWEGAITMKSKRSALLPLLVLVLSIVTCNAPQTAVPDVSATPTERPASSPTPRRTTQEPTREPTTRATAPPTPTPPEAHVARIQFASGTTSETLDGHLGADEVERYVLRALAGQIMHVRVTSPEQSVRLRVEARSGAPIEGRTEGETFWRGPLPVTQDYGIRVSSDRATDYRLSVVVYAPIVFEPGETSATLTGRLDTHETDHYTLRAQEEQTLDVVVDAPHQVGLTIVGADGVPLKRYVDEEMSWHGELPVTQDYFIELNALEATVYTLTVTLPPLPSEASIEVISPNGNEKWQEGSTHDILWHASGVAKVDIEVASGGKPLGHVALAVDATAGQYRWEIPVGLVSNFGAASSDAMRVRVYSSDDPGLYDESDDPFTVSCPRISLEPGAAPQSITGTLDADDDRFRYVVGGTEGQAMELHISPARIGIDVWGAEDGSTWQLPAEEGSLIIHSLPETQDYFITLRNAAEPEPVDYTLEIAIR